MRNTIKLFLVLITLVTFMAAWITGRLNESRIILLILLLTGATMLVFFVLNLLDHRDALRDRKKRESGEAINPARKTEGNARAVGSFSLRERKSGLSWGGGNIKASEATRGTRKKFLNRR